MRFSKTILVFGIVLLALGCQTLAKRNSTGVIVARRAQIRSSTAVVAADLLQVNRGDVVDILDSTDVTDPSDNSRKERWLRVKARDTDATEGWIEARNVMPDDVLDQSKKLATEDKDIPAQATGQLRASSNLRLSPDRSGNENIMMRLDSGSSFDIISWKRVPKPKSSEAIETDVAPKAGSVQQGSSATLWGQRENKDKDAGDKDAAHESNPGSWLILEKSSSTAPHGVDEPDFDRIYVLGSDKRNQEHYTAYRSPDLRGYLPAKVEGQGESKSFTGQVQEEEGGPTKEVRS